MNLIKQKPWRSKKYLKWVRSQPCCITGRTDNIVAHHITTAKSRGMGTKADDFFCIPLTSETHQLLHSDPLEFEIMYGRQDEYWKNTISRAIREGGLDGFERWTDGL